jgi:formate-nitrite transporter family protein
MKHVINFLKHPAFITSVIILLGIAGLVTLVIATPSEPQESADAVERYWGVEDADIVVTNYSDFQCPACGQFHELTASQLKETYDEEIKFVFKHFPLPSYLPNSQTAAEAAEAAGAQGKFWEYHDLLYARQNESSTWGISTFVDYAEELELDTERFDKELRDDVYRQAVRDSVDEGNEAGVNATPSIFINDEKIDNPTFETLQARIEALQAETETTPSPTATPTKKSDEE